MDRQVPRVLLVGSLPPPIGGTTVSFKSLVESLKQLHELDVTVFDTSRFRGCGYVKLAQLWYALIREIIQTDCVTLHLSIRQYAGAGLFLCCFARMFGKPLIVRRFGGVCIGDIKNVLIRRLIQASCLLADLILCQTKAQLREAVSLKGKKAVWFPTARANPHHRIPRSATFTNRIVFVSQVQREKGLFTLIDAVKMFDATRPLQLDVYGPLRDGITKEQIERENVTYKGTAKPSEIYAILGGADVLVFPTFYPGEGYSGTLVEALLSGTPVIATDWKYNSELLGKAAIYAKPNDAKSLRDALEKFYSTENAVALYSQRALERSKLFTQEKQTGIFLDAVKVAITSRSK